MEIQMDCSDNGVMRLEGELTIQYAGRLKETLMTAFSELKELSLNLEGVTGIDIACMQVLCSAHKTFSAANKSFAVHGRVAPSFKQSVQDSGYARMSGCQADLQRTCLWAIGGRDE